MFLHLSVSHSVHGWRGGLCMMSLPVWLPCPMFLLGEGLWSMFLQGVSVQRGLPDRDPWTETPLDRDPLARDPIPVEKSPCALKSGRCASYWNAFLFSMRTVLLALSQSFRSVDIDVWLKRALWVSHKYTGFHLLRVQLQRASGFYEQISSL